MNNNSSKQVLLSVIGVAILVVAVVGVSFAFFNYSRTGTEVNQFQVGTITFSASDDVATLDNAFPVAPATAASATNSTDDVAVITVTINGNTTYANGIDFTVTAIPESTNTMNPELISFVVTTPTVDGLTFTQTATELSATGNTVICAGKIAVDKTVTAAAITIKMYVDSSKVLITDTPTDEGTQAIINGRTTVSTAEWNAKSYSFKINIWAVQGGGAADPRA